MHIYQYKYVACKRCRSENILQQTHEKTGEKILHCLDCGWYNSKSESIEEPYGVLIWCNINTGDKIAKSFSTKEECDEFIKPLMSDPEIIYIEFSTLNVVVINKTRLK